MKKGGKLDVVLAEVAPPKGLYRAVMARIAAASQRAARIRAVLLGSVAGASCVALVPVLEYAVHEFWSSGFFDYSSLLLSDNALVMASWKEFAFSLAESVPSIAILLVASVGILLVWSGRRALRDARVGFSSLSRA